MSSKAVRLILFLSTVVGAAAMVQRVALGRERDQPLVISRVILVASRQIDRDFVEDVFRAEVTHTAAPGSHDMAGVTARIVRPFGDWFPGPPVEIVDGEVEFGSVRAGRTVESRDTVTIRHRGRHPLPPQRLRWAIAGRPDVVFSDAWAGTWRFTITSRDPDTLQIAAVADITDTIGAEEPVGFSLLPEFVRCTWTGSDDRLESECRARFRFEGCLADGSAHFTIERTGGSITGRGQSDIVATGACGPNTGSGGESIDITGVRIGEEAEPEPFSPGVLTKLATSPAFIGLIAGAVKEAAEDEPTSEEDCKRGRWRRLTNPVLRNARACLEFVGRHHGPHDERRR